MPFIAVHVTLFKHYLPPPFPTTCPMPNEHKIKGTPNDQVGGCQYHTAGTGIKARSRIIIINARWPENWENVQMLPPAIFVCWFHIYVFHKRTFFTSQQLSWAPWDAAMFVFLLLKNRKRIGHDITYTRATHADLAHDITDTSRTQDGSLLRAMFYNFQMLMFNTLDQINGLKNWCEWM